MHALKMVITPNRQVSKALAFLCAAAWAAATLLAWSYLSPNAFPRPLEVLAAGLALFGRNDILRDFWASFSLNLEVILKATIVSLLIAYGSVLPIMRPLATATALGRFLGQVGLSFVLTVLVGPGHSLKVWMLVIAVSTFFVTSMNDVVAGIPKEKFNHARSLKMGEWRVTWEVVIRGTFDKALECLRQNAAIGWMMLTMVEGVSRTEGGVGTMLLNGEKHHALATIFAIQAMMYAVGLLQDFGLGWTRRVLCPYADLDKERG